MKKTGISPKNKSEFLFDAKGNKVGVLLPKKEYEKLMDIVDGYHDYQETAKLRKKVIAKK